MCRDSHNTCSDSDNAQNRGTKRSVSENMHCYRMHKVTDDACDNKRSNSDDMSNEGNKTQITSVVTVMTCRTKVTGHGYRHW